MFSSERRRHFGLPGDIFRKLYPHLPRCEFSGQSRMIPQILRFRSSASKELQLLQTDRRIRLRESSCLRETFDYVNADSERRVSMRLNRKYERKNSVSIKTYEIYLILICEFVELKLTVSKLYFLPLFISFFARYLYTQIYNVKLDSI